LLSQLLKKVKRAIVSYGGTKNIIDAKRYRPLHNLYGTPFGGHALYVLSLITALPCFRVDFSDWNAPVSGFALLVAVGNALIKVHVLSDSLLRNVSYAVRPLAM